MGKPVGDIEKEALLYQWCEYSECYLTTSSLKNHLPIIFKELNNILRRQSYFIGNTKTEADEKLYEELYPEMVKFTYKEKEEYVHLSRWFNQIQNCLNVSEDKVVLFSRSLIYS